MAQFRDSTRATPDCGPLGGSKTAVEPDIRPQSTDEIVVVGEYAISPNSRLGVEYRKRYLDVFGSNGRVSRAQALLRVLRAQTSGEETSATETPPRPRSYRGT